MDEDVNMQDASSANHAPIVAVFGPLPEAIMPNVFSYVSMKEVSEISQLNSSFESVTRSDDFWLPIIIRMSPAVLSQHKYLKDHHGGRSPRSLQELMKWKETRANLLLNGMGSPLQLPLMPSVRDSKFGCLIEMKHPSLNGTWTVFQERCAFMDHSFFNVTFPSLPESIFGIYRNDLLNLEESPMLHVSLIHATTGRQAVFFTGNIFPFGRGRLIDRRLEERITAMGTNKHSGSVEKRRRHFRLFSDFIHNYQQHELPELGEVCLMKLGGLRLLPSYHASVPHLGSSCYLQCCIHSFEQGTLLGINSYSPQYTPDISIFSEYRNDISIFRLATGNYFV